MLKDDKATEVAKAKAAIEQEKVERAEKAKAEIEAIMQKYRVIISLGMLINDKGNFPQISIVAGD